MVFPLCTAFCSGYCYSEICSGDMINQNINKNALFISHFCVTFFVIYSTSFFMFSFFFCNCFWDRRWLVGQFFCSANLINPAKNRRNNKWWTSMTHTLFPPPPPSTHLSLFILKPIKGLFINWIIYLLLVKHVEGHLPVPSQNTNIISCTSRHNWILQHNTALCCAQPQRSRSEKEERF